MRRVANSSNCCGPRRLASVFAFGVTALYVRKKRCQYKCRNVLAFLGSGVFAAVTHFKYCKSRYQEPGFRKFQKIDLTTIFANVKPPPIGDRIVSVRLRGGFLGGSIQLTISHSSFPAFSVSIWSGIRSGRCASARAVRRGLRSLHRRSGSPAMRLVRCWPWIRILRFLICFQASDGAMSGVESDCFNARETALRI